MQYQGRHAVGTLKYEHNAEDMLSETTEYRREKYFVLTKVLSSCITMALATCRKTTADDSCDNVNA